MRRTNKLLSGVITSILVLGSAERGNAAIAHGRQVDHADSDAWKTDARVGGIAEQVFQELESKMPEDGETVPDLGQKLPKLAKADIEIGLKRLLYEARIKREGEGTEASPYKYYERDHHTG